ncbi:hypothetical protein CHH47_28340 [Priestia megaterium]|nr:hypothetical protein CHH47_28340 [Priestia megaterium]
MRVLGPHAGQNTNSNDPEEIGERLRKEIQKTKQLMNKPFGVNHNLVGDRLEDHPISNQILKVCVEENVKVLSVVGTPNEQGIKKTKELGFTVIFEIRTQLLQEQKPQALTLLSQLVLGYEVWLQAIKLER